MKKVASLRYGVIFKKAFSQPDIFKAFVKDFLGIDLNINQVEMEKQFSPVIGKVDTRFDLFAEDTDNRVIVNIQHVRYGDHYDRFLHYHCAALLEQIANSDNYRPNLKVFTIVVLTSGDRHKVDIATTDFAPKDRFGKYLNELPHKILFVSPKYVTEDTPEPYREWLLAIADTLDEEVDETSYQHKEIRHIFDLIEQDSISPQERFKMKDEYGMEQLQQDHALKMVKKIARNLLAKGIDPAIVVETTGISADDLEKLNQSRGQSS